MIVGAGGGISPGKGWGDVGINVRGGSEKHQNDGDNLEICN